MSLGSDIPSEIADSDTDVDSRGHNGSHDERILRIELTTKSASEIIKRIAALNPRSKPRHEAKNVEVVASTCISGGDEDGTVRIVTGSPPGDSERDDPSARQRWM